MIETLYILYGKKEVRKLYNHTLRSRLFLRAQGTSEIKFISPFFRLEIGIGQTTKKTFTFIFYVHRVQAKLNLFLPFFGWKLELDRQQKRLSLSFLFK